MGKIAYGRRRTEKKTVTGLCIMHSICMENKNSFVHRNQIILAIYSDFYYN